MKNSLTLFIGLILICIFGPHQPLLAQINSPSDTLIHPFSQDWNVGGSMLTNWSSIALEEGDAEFFFKPSVGASIQLEWFPSTHVGLGTGLGFVTKGFGKKNKDWDDSLGNPDSTHREHFNFRCLDLPLYLILRSDGLRSDSYRFIAKVGGGWTYNMRAVSVFHSVEDGFHERNLRSEDFFKSDVFGLASAGLEINAGGVNTMQLLFYVQSGRNSVFEPGMAFGSTRGHNRSYGLQIAVFY
jgi:hypothetical protein